jgi:hypothetical protein
VLESRVLVLRKKTGVIMVRSAGGTFRILIWEDSINRHMDRFNVIELAVEPSARPISRSRCVRLKDQLDVGF